MYAYMPFRTCVYAYSVYALTYLHVCLCVQMERVNPKDVGPEKDLLDSDPFNDGKVHIQIHAHVHVYILCVITWA